MTSEHQSTHPEIETIEAQWTQADTPGSDVELEKLPNAAEEETTQIASDDEPEPEAIPTTQVAVAVDDAAATPTVVHEARRLYRDPFANPDTAIAQDEAEALAAAQAEQAAAEAAEAARVEAARAAAERAARNRALGIVAPTGEAITAPTPPQRLVTDRFLGAFGLFLTRLIVAGVLGIRAYQMVTDMPAFQQQLDHTQLPEPHTLAWVAAISMWALALAFLFGAFVRVAGFGLVVTSVLALVFVRWGSFSPFVAGEYGFRGELELVLVGLGLVFCCLGGGRWGVDGSFRAARAKAKASKEA